MYNLVKNDLSLNIILKSKAFLIRTKLKMFMKTVYTVTQNKYKVNDLQRAFDVYNIKVEQIDSDSPEIQADTCEEVVSFVSKYLATKYNKPIVKLDFGFFIDSLGGLPGVYAKYFHKKLGLKKILTLMDGEQNRKAYMSFALAYCEPGKEPVVFSHKIYGTITDKLKSSEKWLTDILVPDGETCTMGEIREHDREKELTYYGDAERKFAEWFVKQYKND